jgi:phosphoribosylformylglycinamidine cyclo-ligase
MATYREAGVDLEAAERSVARIGPAVRRTWSEDVVGNFGGFAAGIRVPAGVKEPVMMMSTDGVGTKADVARRAGLLDGLGFDLVAMCADDLAAAGAVPIAMTDYLAVGRLDDDVVAALVESVAAACEEAGIALLGGETAEHPGVMAIDEFDLAGTALGVVEAGHEVDGSSIRPGDAIVGVSSPNLRSNGFSLVRATILRDLALDDDLPGTGRTVAEEVLAPSVIYAPAVIGLLGEVRPNGLAHITGGGLPGNITRVLPPGTAAQIDPQSWQRPPVFEAVAAATAAAESELYRTFNMGIGFVAVTAPGDVETTISAFASAGHPATQIGVVTPGAGEVFIGRP